MSIVELFFFTLSKKANMHISQNAELYFKYRLCDQHFKASAFKKLKLVRYASISFQNKGCYYIQLAKSIWLWTQAEIPL